MACLWLFRKQSQFKTVISSGKIIEKVQNNEHWKHSLQSLTWNQFKIDHIQLHDKLFRITFLTFSLALFNQSFKSWYCCFFFSIIDINPNRQKRWHRFHACGMIYGVTYYLLFSVDEKCVIWKNYWFSLQKLEKPEKFAMKKFLRFKGSYKVFRGIYTAFCVHASMDCLANPVIYKSWVRSCTKKFSGLFKVPT